jgi:uncharacterized membrane protein YkoI
MKMTYIYLGLVVGTISFSAFGDDDDFSAQQIRQMVSQGKILPLETILEIHKPLVEGKLLDLEVESEHGKIIYELEFLKQNGDVVKLVIDAKTGELLDQEID